MTNPSTEFRDALDMAALSLAPEVRIRSGAVRKRAVGSYLPKAIGERLANISLFFGASLFMFAVFIAATMSDGVEASSVWTHSVIALSLAQFMMLAGVAFKVASRLERYRQLLLNSSPITRKRPLPAERAAFPRPAASGLLSGRTYVAFVDGTVEIDTLLGRRRFVNLDAAREFVGG